MKDPGKDRCDYECEDFERSEDDIDSLMLTLVCFVVILPVVPYVAPDS